MWLDGGPSGCGRRRAVLFLVLRAWTAQRNRADRQCKTGWIWSVGVELFLAPGTSFWSGFDSNNYELQVPQFQKYFQSLSEPFPVTRFGDVTYKERQSYTKDDLVCHKIWKQLLRPSSWKLTKEHYLNVWSRDFESASDSEKMSTIC